MAQGFESESTTVGTQVHTPIDDNAINSDYTIALDKTPKNKTIDFDS